MSFEGFTHAPLHSIVLFGQTHWPLMQSEPVGQTLPQAPQFAASFARLVQAEAQSTCVASHPHTPLLQLAPGLQALSQEPQCALSVARSTQSSPHDVPSQTPPSPAAPPSPAEPLSPLPAASPALPPSPAASPPLPLSPAAASPPLPADDSPPLPEAVPPAPAPLAPEVPPLPAEEPPLPPEPAEAPPEPEAPTSSSTVAAPSSPPQPTTSTPAANITRSNHALLVVCIKHLEEDLGFEDACTHDGRSPGNGATSASPSRELRLMGDEVSELSNRAYALRLVTRADLHTSRSRRGGCADPSRPVASRRCNPGQPAPFPSHLGYRR